MNVNGIGSQGVNQAASYAAAAKATDKVAQTTEEATKKPNTDKVEINTDQSKKVELPKKLSADQVREIKAQAMESYSNMVTQMFNGQVDNAGQGSKNFMAKLQSVLKNSVSSKVEESTSIANDPTWGVDAVATRLMDMAISLSGGDSSKADALRAAVEKGFKAAGAELGGKLPGVSNDTYTEVMKRFDYWKETGSMDGYKYAQKD